jgi:hypothetical protein
MTHGHAHDARGRHGERGHDHRRTEKRSSRARTGTEPMTAKRVNPATKSWLAAGGLLICAGLGVLAWVNGYAVAAWILLVLAVLALADVIWQRWKQARGMHD